jgi:hypothetical protein
MTTSMQSIHRIGVSFKDTLSQDDKHTLGALFSFFFSINICQCHIFSILPFSSDYRTETLYGDDHSEDLKAIPFFLLQFFIHVFNFHITVNCYKKFAVIPV